jgi:hypothetical protein
MHEVGDRFEFIPEELKQPLGISRDEIEMIYPYDQRLTFSTADTTAAVASISAPRSE